jgi:hypothetical protein
MIQISREFFDNISIYFIGVVSGLIGILIAQAVRVMLFRQRTAREVKVRLDERYRSQYIELYKIAREVTLALDSLLQISQKKTTSSKRQFIVLAYELLRNNAITFIDKLDWRQNDSIIYLPSDLEARCVRIRASLYEGLSRTAIRPAVQIKHFRNNATQHYSTVDIAQLEKWSRSGTVWPNILHFRRQDFVESSPFMDSKYVSALRDDLIFVTDYLKAVFTH